MNRFMVTATYLNGELIFSGITNFIPHKGEEFIVRNRSYFVHHVIYTVVEGNCNAMPVKILLA